MTVEPNTGFTCIRYHMRMSGVADPEDSWVERREVTWGAVQWR